MSTFASEKRAPGICDRCGRRAPLRTMRSETIQGKRVNNRVCRGCWDPENQQDILDRVRPVERTGLKNPRTDMVEQDRVRSMPGWDPIGNDAILMVARLGQAHVR